jgi:hypothetical protein
MTRLSRRQLFAAAGGAAGAAATGLLLGRHVWPLLTREDLVPGAAPDVTLRREAWTESGHRLSFAAFGDNGSGGRQAMAVATEMARTYQQAPFGLVALLGDICYYGNFEDRFEDVFTRPMRPLLDAGVGFELAIDNHDADQFHSDEGLAEIEAELRLLGTPATYYTTTHGPMGSVGVCAGRSRFRSSSRMVRSTRPALATTWFEPRRLGLRVRGRWSRFWVRRH